MYVYPLRLGATKIPNLGKSKGAQSGSAAAIGYSSPMSDHSGGHTSTPGVSDAGRERPSNPESNDSVGPGRVRRPADLLSSLLALVVIVIVLGLIQTLPIGSTEISNDVSRWLTHVPSWLAYGVAVAAEIGCLVFAIAALSALFQREPLAAINAIVAAVVAAAAAVIACTIWHFERGAISQAVLHGKNPSTFVIDCAFIAFLVASDLVRHARWSRWSVLAGAVLLLSGLAIDALTPFALFVALFAGLFIGWGVRWLLRTASVRPGTEELERWLSEYHNLHVRDLFAPPQSSSAHLAGTLPDGTLIGLWLANRDTQGLGLVRQLWVRARLRPRVAGHVALGFRSQLQQLALASYRAKSSGVLCPTVLLLNELPAETLVLAMAMPHGIQFTEAVGPESGRLLFGALRELHDAGVAHRDLRAENLLVGETSAGFSSLDSAIAGAGELVQRLDVAQLLTTLAKTIGPDNAIEALRSAYKPRDEGAIAATLQPIALAPWGWSAMREARGCIAELRHELIGPDTNMPIIRLERFRWRTVASTIALTIAAYLLIGQISRVNLLGALRQTNLGWFAVAILGSALTYFAAAENLAAFVPKKLSPIRGFFVQLATAFVGVAMPPTVGHIAVNARYLARQKVDEGSITAAVALSQIVNVVTTVLLLAAFGLLTGSGISRFHIVPGTDLLLGLAAIAVVAGILLLIPQTRAQFNHHVWPRLRNVWPRLVDALSQPGRLALGIFSNLLLTFGYLVAFIAALKSLGAHPAILAASVVYLAGNTVGSIAPTPGGLGAVETVLAAGLTAIGIPAHQAIPAVLIFRIATFWLPIPAGWISFVVLQRRGVL